VETTPAASKSSWIFAGVAVAIALVAVGAGIWVTMRPAAPAVAALPVNATEAPPSAPLPDPAATPPPATTAATPAVAAAAAPSGAPPAASASTAKPAAGPPPAKAAAAKVPPPAAVPSKDVEAGQRLDVAKAKLASSLVDPAVADLRQIMLDYPGTAFAVDAAFLAGEALEKAGRDEDAMAAYVEFDRRFPNHPRMADSQLRRARLMQRSKVQAHQTDAYTLYGAIARDFPGTPEAKQALLAKRQIEGQRRQLRATDPVLNIEVPALLVTLRALGDQFPGAPETMLALNQLAAAYEDMNRYEAAAEILERLAAQFPGNPVEVWFQLGELYDRRLKNTERAREAYAKVPANSPRYREAQQRLKRR
jgi:TolA-binding protein